jgi:membrane associated rhomboid family serine protease
LWCLPSHWDKGKLGSVTTIIRHAKRTPEEPGGQDVTLKSKQRCQGCRLCPACYDVREPFTAWQVGGDAGVELLRCERCGGIWLEPGEWDQLETLLSSMFLHAGLIHLAVNMYFLYVLGDNVKDALGHVGYLCFYLVCGTAGGLTWLLFNSTSNDPCIGASGAIAGVMAAYFVLFRQARLTLMVLFWQWKVRGIVWLGLWFVFQVFASTLDIARVATAVAHLAHVGGFVAGLVIIWPLQRVLMKQNAILRVLRLYRPTLAQHPSGEAAAKVST